MSKKKILNLRGYSSVIIAGLVSFYLLNIFSVAIPVIPIELYYRGILIIEVLLICLVFIQSGWRCGIDRNGIKRIGAIFFTQLLAYLMTGLYEEYDCFDVHRLLVFLLMYFVFFEYAKQKRISFKFNYLALKSIIYIGIGACLYNLLMHGNTILSFNLETIMMYTSTYSSFFLTRSNYCLLLTVGYVIALYFHEIEKKKKWLLISIFFAVNVFLTNARTSIITIIIVSCVFLLLQKNKAIRNLYFVLFCMIIIVFIPWDILLGDLSEFIEKYYLLFFRNTEDFSSGRFGLWTSLFQDLNPINIFIGHGIGSKDAYLTSIAAIALSFHNLWLDLFYEGGLFLLAIYIYTMYFVLKKVNNSYLSNAAKQLFYCYMVILIVSGMGDAIASPFLLDTSSIFSTIIFITIPICVSNESNNNERNEVIR